MTALSAPAAAQHMNADVFYQRAMKLKSKGPLALFARKELKALIAEVRAAGTQVRETRLAAERVGKRGRYCPPKMKREMGHEEYLKGIGAIPAGERRRIDMVEATTRMLATKYPCKG
ncbi:MAG TPA: hypothetical protein VNR68_02295 [Sphingomicrobium sp.]|nr:hypothetical protein [Sphingomicrobium sp.]